MPSYTFDASQVAINAINQLYGSGILPVADGANPTTTTISALDQYTVTDLGKLVTGSNTIAANFLSGLIDQCGKVVMESRDYIPELPSLYVDAVDWGGFTEHVHVGLSDIMTDEMWNDVGFVNYSDTTGNGTYTGPTYAQHIAEVEHGYYQPRKHAKIFDKSSQAMVPLSTARDQLFSAFKGVDELTRFISMLYQSVQNTLKAKAEVYALMLVQSAISITINKLDGSAARDHAVHLCTEFLALTGTDYTSAPEAAMLDPVFMSFALSRIAEVRDNMTRYSTAYNNGNDVTFTPKSDSKLILLSKFTRSAKFGVRANTFHEELLGIGDYDNLTTWQAINDTGLKAFDFATASTVKISAASAVMYRLDANGSPWQSTDGDYTANNVIGLMYDKYALGVSLDKQKTTSNYIAANDVWNTFSHALINQIINDDYNMCVFVLD